MKTMTLTLADIVLIIVISAMVAIAVQLWFQARTKSAAAAPGAVKSPAAASQSITAGISQEHLAVITTAVAAMFGAHRVVRIEAQNRGVTWTAEARTVHHTSHATR